MAETFSLFGLQGYAYGLCAAAGAALFLIGMRFSGRGLPRGTVGLFGVLAMVFGIVFARALYCAVNWNDFAYNYENPMLALRFFDGGLSLPGVIAGMVLAAAVTARVVKVRFAQVMDALAVPFGMLIWGLRLGEQFTELGVGAAVDEGFMTAHFPWLFLESRMGVMVEYRLNVWMYEMVAGLVLFAVGVRCFERLKNHPGDTAIVVFSLYGASQILLESMRDDGHMLIIFLRVGQLGAAALLIAASAILTKRAGRLCRTAMWIDTAACVLGIVLLEFSLDGRITIGHPTLLRDYLLMTILLINMAMYPCWLLLKRKQA